MSFVLLFSVKNKTAQSFDSGDIFTRGLFVIKQQLPTPQLMELAFAGQPCPHQCHFAMRHLPRWSDVW